MKFIKSYKIFESIDSELGKELSKFDIIHYTINDDGSIDVNDDVIMIDENLNEIPFKFNKIYYAFSVARNKLKSLKNCPKYIGTSFICIDNQLESLEFGPDYVGTNYFCNHNELKTLKGCVEEVNGDFDCQNNKLTSLEFCPMEVNGEFDCSENKLEYLDRSPFIKGNLFCCDMFKSEPEFNGYCYKLIWNETH